ncbi:phosphatidylinositol-glycan biosynthesis class F protein [Phymastichus coffea]|uniref:phosphatidylinositol-glycan biosynthesis class F protein n=1 Tax=Phymastichus coffea TaxID=108790 RepID=UPI00273AFC92|nr:phosphatidylinositol-glycan biosynthesis class F protein [Phymastichus coffea]
MRMKIGYQDHQFLLFQSLITCTYFAAILLFLYFSGNIYNVGKYKFISILIIIVLAEFVKIFLANLQLEQLPTVKVEQNYLNKTKRNVTKFIKDTLKFSTVAAITIFIYFIVIVLFGAPLLTHHEETLMLALTLTTLTLIPTTFHLGIENMLILFTGSQSLPHGILLESITLNIKAVICGTWCSAFVIPLDWDRPWQAWPIPCIIGALLGCFAGHFITLIKVLMLRLKKKR